MTRPQYLALCAIGGIAIVAYLQSYRIGKLVQAMSGGSVGRSSGSSLIV